MPISAEVYTLNAYYSALSPTMVRAMMDRFGDAVRLKGNKAQLAAYDYLMLGFADRNFPMEVNLEIAKKFGLYPSRFDLDDSLRSDLILITVNERIVGQIESLAIPLLYANLSSV